MSLPLPQRNTSTSPYKWHYVTSAVDKASVSGLMIFRSICLQYGMNSKRILVVKIGASWTVAAYRSDFQIPNARRIFVLREGRRSCTKTNKEAYLTTVSTARHAVFAMASGSHFGRRSHLLVRLPKLLTCLCSSVLRRLPSHLTKLIELR